MWKGNPRQYIPRKPFPQVLFLPHPLFDGPVIPDRLCWTPGYLFERSLPELRGATAEGIDLRDHLPPLA
jgi:hypothetical protein